MGSIDKIILAKEFGDLKSAISLTRIKTDYKNLYIKLSDLAKENNVYPSKLFGIFRIFKDFRFESDCVNCGLKYSTLDKSGLCCSKSCQSKWMHATRSDETKESFNLKLKISNERRRKSGDLSETSRKAYRTRRTVHGENGIHEQSKRAGLKTKEKFRQKRITKRQVLIDRLSRILERKNHLLILRLFYKDFTMIYENLIDKLIELGFEQFSDYRSDIFRYIVRNGFEYKRYCKVCNVLIGIHNEYCSQTCYCIDEEVKIRQSKHGKEIWKRSEYRNLQISILKRRHSSYTKDRYDKWSRMSLDTLGPAGILRRRDKALKTKLERGIISRIGTDEEINSEYRVYRRTVGKLTKKVKLLYFRNIVFGKKTLHLDHIYPIQQGFLNKIPPELIGCIDNLRVLPARINRLKSNKIILVPEHIEEFLKNAENQ